MKTKSTSSKKKAVILSTKIFLFLIIACIAVLTAYGYRFNLEKQVLEETGVLDIFTYPSKAEVHISNKKEKYETPQVVHDIKLGASTIVITKEKFRPMVHDIHVTKEKAVVLSSLYLIPEFVSSFFLPKNITANEWKTSGNLLFFFQTQEKRLGIYDITSQQVSWMDVLIPQEYISFIDTSGMRLQTIFPLEDNRFFIGLQEKFALIADIKKGTQEFLVFPDNTTQIIASPLDKNTLLFLNGKNVFQYDFSEKKEHQALAYTDVSSLFEEPNTLWICYEDQTALQVTKKGILNSTLEEIKIQKPICPLKKIVYEEKEISFLRTDGKLFYLSQESPQSVDFVYITENKKEIYKVEGRALYYENTEKETPRMLLGRFEHPISALTKGPHTSTVFLQTNKSIFLCSTLLEHCSFVYELGSPVSIFEYSDKSFELIFNQKQSLFSLDFSFWKN